MSNSVPASASSDKAPDPFTATDEQLAELFADADYEAYCAERDHDRAVDEAEIARRYEAEHRERFGNDFDGDSGEGEPW